MKKQIIAKVLVLAMVLAMVPVTVLAASAAGSNLGYGNYGYYSIGKDTTVVTKLSSDGTIKLTVKDGVASAVINDTIIDTLLEKAEDGKVVVALEGDDITQLNFTCSAKVLANVAKSGADLVLKTSFGTITIPNELLAEIGNAGTVRIYISNTDDGITVNIEVAGELLDNASIKVEAVSAE